MDLRGLTFEECRFEQVTWANCTFDASTRFDRCQFIGASVAACKGAGLAEFQGCTKDSQAAYWINTARVTDGKRRYSAEDLKADIGSVIAKFLARGGMALRCVEESNLLRGPIKNSRYSGDILDELRRSVLDTHHISGVSNQGYHVREEAEDAVRFYGANNVLTGPLLEVFERLRRKLV
jgi:hypothetical protein